MRKSELMGELWPIKWGEEEEEDDPWDLDEEGDEGDEE